MEYGQLVPINELQNIELNEEVHSLVQAALRQATQAVASISELRITGHPYLGRIPESIIESTSLLSVNAMLQASEARCTRAAPPEPIDVTNDSNGRLIYRCRHSPPHEWNLDGNKIP